MKKIIERLGFESWREVAIYTLLGVFGAVSFFYIYCGLWLFFG